MIKVIRICRKRGTKILSDAPEGLCTGCVLETALGLSPDTVAGVADDGCGSAENLQTNNADIAQRVKTAARAKMLGELGDYELLEEVGRGGQGVVFRARQKSLNRIVALKVIGLGQWATKAHLKRFRLEAEAAASLDHPCIVLIYEVGKRDGQCYFSMKFVEGGQLDEVVKHTPILIRQAVELIAKVARTVSYAHEHGILHRDIKPGNILLDVKWEPHLTDFGLARLVESESTVTRTLEVLGTPSYMAPEQAAGNNTKLTSATDVYGLGAVLYQLLTSHPPFAGGTTYETIKLLLETEPRSLRLWNPKVDRDLSTICLKCLEKDPQHRYSSAIALAEDLERWLKHEPIQARRTGVVGRGKKWLQRNPTAAAVTALSLALMASLGVIVWKSDLFRRPAAAGIAVLPFENLSNDREDASFADGIQDDLLTKLAKIADLKVISRTSVMGYQGKQNTREIGDALGVSHVLEGSVRKTGAWLHINVQLIDAHTDSHVWAEEYDRDLKDMFAIQSEIAQKVAQQLHAEISPAKKLAIERPPTVDLTAFDLYSAKNLFLAATQSSGGKPNLLRVADLLNQAVAYDPTFFQAYCQLALVHDQLYQSHLGDQALFSNTAGGGNTAMGDQALSSNTSGNENTAVGNGALFSNTTSGDNTAIGYFALSNNTSGSGNIAVGIDAGINVTTADNVICIGAVGENATGGCYIGGIFDEISSGGGAVFINSAGKLGTSPSSRQFKEEIRPMERDSEVLFALKPVSFRYRKEIDPQRNLQYGLVAEDVEAVNPDLVVRDKQGKPYSVRYEQVNAMLLNEFIKEHRKLQKFEARVAQQRKDFETTITELKKEIATIAARSKAHSAKIEKVSAQVELSKPATRTVANK
jgi:TolB-like protein